MGLPLLASANARSKVLDDEQDTEKTLLTNMFPIKRREDALNGRPDGLLASEEWCIARFNYQSHFVFFLTTSQRGAVLHQRERASDCSSRENYRLLKRARN
jgi:hypothetical protein